jgi:hypothetical protein
MDFLPWSIFTRIVARYGGDARVRTLCCAEQYRAMAFAQLVAIVKKRLVLEASLYTLLQVFSVTLFEKMPMSQALSKTRTTFEENEMGSQLNLFDF